jgi:ACS family hexuronate transporter-like MFS transporter
MKMHSQSSLTSPTTVGDSAKWWICGLLLLATVLNYLDRQVLSLSAERVIDEFKIDKEGFGQILAWFRYSYAFLQIFGGWIVDAAGARLVFPLAVGLWSIAGILTAFTRTVGGLSACRLLLGVGEAFNWPCALKTTQRLLDPADRPLANGIFNSGQALGAMLAPAIVTVMAIRSGWRAPFIVTGALGLVWVVLWMFSMRGRARQMAGEPVAIVSVPMIMLKIARRRDFWLLATSAIVINGVSYFLADWIPLYLKTERDFSFALGNALSVLVYAGLDMGNLLVGFLVRRALRNGAPITVAHKTALRFSCILMSTAVLAGFTPNRYIALLCIILTAIGVAGFLVLYLTEVQYVDPLHVGTASGMLGGLGNLVYGIVSPYIGKLADLHQTTLTFVLIGALPWLAYASIIGVIRSRQ